MNNRRDNKIRTEKPSNTTTLLAKLGGNTLRERAQKNKQAKLEQRSIKQEVAANKENLVQQQPTHTPSEKNIGSPFSPGRRK